jgi:hypothetical protein
MSDQAKPATVESLCADIVGAINAAVAQRVNPFQLAQALARAGSGKLLALEVMSTLTKRIVSARP